MVILPGIYTRSAESREDKWLISGHFKDEVDGDSYGTIGAKGLVYISCRCGALD
jgi:hypothetical protein